MKKMGFRTITSSILIDYSTDEIEIISQLEKISRQIKIIQEQYSEITTLRISIIFNEKISISSLPGLINKLIFVKNISKKFSIRWFSLTLNSDQFENIENIPEIVKTIILKIPSIFIHLVVSKNIKSVFEYFAKTIIEVSRLSYNGFDNFRLGISNGKTNNTPFFPFANFKDKLNYSVGLETLKDLIEEFYANPELTMGKKLLNYRKKLELTLKDINEFLEHNSILEYKGIDASLAPRPKTIQSIGLLYEFFGVSTLGNLGSLSITSRLTDFINKTFDSSKAKRAGFNGVMFSPLEDDWLAKQSVQGILNIEQLMLYSTVCGCGIDMLPLPGDIFGETIASLICDVITLSYKLNKPLGIRVLPIPGKLSNEKTNFNHDFLSDMKIINIKDSILPRIDF